MKIIRNLNIQPIKNPISLTIGNFDGVHLGHLSLLKRLTEVAKQKGGQSVVITFENHTKTLLSSTYQHLPICTLNEKHELLKKAGVDNLVILQFTHEIKEQTAESFLDFLQHHIPFSHLILGHDSVFGKNRHGTKEYILAKAKLINIEVEYLPPLLIDDKPVSSSLIRKAMQEGDFIKAEKLLGRKIKQ